jgi:hypothetical protein
MGYDLYHIGFEFESMVLIRGMISGSVLNKLGLMTKHDASCETPHKLIGGFIFDNVGLNIKAKDIILGAELVTKGVVNTQGDFYLDSFIKPLCKFLFESGEPAKSKRAGIHVHVSFAYNTRILKNVLRLVAFAEDILFHLGGMGYEFRGIFNDSVYCRPITKWGPPVIEATKGYAQCYTIDDLLDYSQVKKTSDFWIRYGNLDVFGGQTYTPVRYSIINLKSLYNQSSLEFRGFNTSLNPLYIWAVIEFCIAFSKFCISTNKKEMENLGLTEMNSIYDFKRKGELYERYRYLAKILKIPYRVDEILLEILQRTPPISLEKKYVYSHVMNRAGRYWGGYTYQPSIITSNIHQPTYVDIHTIQRNRRR